MNPVCTKLPKSKAVKTMCQTVSAQLVSLRLTSAVPRACSTLAIPYAFFVWQVIGNPAQIPTHIFKHPEALFVLPNSWHHTLVTVSREANDLCTALKKVNPNWRGHLLVQSSATGCLFYLGQYQGGASQKITADEYHSLPEEVGTSGIMILSTISGSLADLLIDKELCIELRQNGSPQGDLDPRAIVVKFRRS